MVLSGNLFVKVLMWKRLFYAWMYIADHVLAKNIWYISACKTLVLRLLTNCCCSNHALSLRHGDVIEWKHFPRYGPFMRGNHWSTVNSPHKGQWHGASMFSVIYAWTNCWGNNRDAGGLRRYHPIMTSVQWKVVADDKCCREVKDITISLRPR